MSELDSKPDLRCGVSHCVASVTALALTSPLVLSDAVMAGVLVRTQTSKLDHQSLVAVAVGYASASIHLIYSLVPARFYSLGLSYSESQ